MKITNPTDKAISMQYAGIAYTIAPKDSSSVSDAVAKHWKAHVHHFVILSEDTTEEPVKEAKEPAPAEAPSISEEVEEEKPKAARKGKK